MVRGVMASSTSYLYEETLERICGKIRRGEYLPGDRLPSIADIANNFQVGRNTALRVISELQLQGLAIKRKGKGTFLRDVITSSSFENSRNVVKKIRRVIFLSKTPKKTRDSSPEQIQDGVLDRTLQLGLACNIEQESVMPKDSQSLSLPFQINDGAGLITQYTADISLLLRETIVRKRFPCVLIDGVFPNVGSVLTDNNFGMSQLVGHLYEMGHRHVAFAGRFSHPGCVFNVTERKEAFARETAKRGMRGDILAATTFCDLLKTLRAMPRISALFFPQDIHAANAVRFLESHGIDIPGDLSVCGFDDHVESGTSSNLTTVRVDLRGLGKAAVDLLIETAQSEDVLMFWKRVQPRLIIRNSVKKIPDNK